MEDFSGFSRVLHAGYRESAVFRRAIAHKPNDSYHAEDLTPSVDFRVHAHAHAGENQHRCGGAGTGNEAGNHQIVKRKARHQPFPEITAGMIIGNVMTKTFNGAAAPRSIAASSIER